MTPFVLGVLAAILALALQVLLWLASGEWPGWNGFDLLFYIEGQPLPKDLADWLSCGVEVTHINRAYCERTFIGVAKIAVYILNMSVATIFVLTGMAGTVVFQYLE